MKRNIFALISVVSGSIICWTGCPDIRGMPTYFIQPYSFASNCGDGDGVGGSFEIDLHPGWEGDVPVKKEFGAERLVVNDVERRPAVANAKYVRVGVGQYECFVPLPFTVTDGVCYLHRELQACKVRVAMLPMRARAGEEQELEAIDPEGSPGFWQGMSAAELLADIREEAEEHFEEPKLQQNEVAP